MSERNKPSRIKRWVIRGVKDEKVLVVVGGKLGRNTKLIIKSLEKGLREHFTLWIGDDGRFYIHRKQEGQVPKINNFG